MNNPDTPPKLATPEQPADKGLDETPCSASSSVKRWQFLFARRIWYHVGVIQTSSHSTKGKAVRAARKMKDNGWAVWEVTPISLPNVESIHPESKP